MNSKKKFIIIALVFVLILAGAHVLYNKLSDGAAREQLAGQDENQNENGEEQTDNERHDEKTKAPDFAVYDEEGNKKGLSDYLGKPVIINFWASWCGPCKMEMPDFDKVYKELGDEIQFMMINLTDGSRETKETAGAYIKEQGFSLPVFYDLDNEAVNIYGAYSIPMTFFIDEEGHLIARATGAIDEQTLRKGIDMIK